MRIVMVTLMLWAAVANAATDDKSFNVIGTMGTAFPAVAKGLNTWVDYSGVVHGFAEVHILTNSGRWAIWAFHFTGCERGEGVAYWSTHVAQTGEPLGQENDWANTYSPGHFPSNYIRPLCEVSRSHWQPLLSKAVGK